MSLVSTLYSGFSGLDGSSQDLSVIGDNIANSNTVGFKAGRAQFEDALAQTIIGAGQVGAGVDRATQDGRATREHANDARRIASSE